MRSLASCGEVEGYYKTAGHAADSKVAGDAANRESAASAAPGQNNIAHVAGLMPQVLPNSGHTWLIRLRVNDRRRRTGTETCADARTSGSLGHYL
jgi:hypothetical protein